MAYARLNAGATQITITRSTSEKHTLTLQNGKDQAFWKTGSEVLGNVNVDEPVTNIPHISVAQADEIQLWLNNQLREINDAFARNAANGVLGGQAVIKRHKKDDITWENHPDFISGRKTGEFLGVISGARAKHNIVVSKPIVTDAEWAEDARKNIYHLGVQNFCRLLSIISDDEFTDLEVSQIAAYASIPSTFMSKLQNERFRIRSVTKKNSNKEAAKQRAVVVEVNVARNKAESDRLLAEVGFGE